MIRLCIFNMSGNYGNIINNYTLSPTTSLINAFHSKNIHLPEKLVNNNNNNINKLAVIKDIMNDKYVNYAWYHRYGYYPNNNTYLDIYEEYIKYQLNQGINKIDILPGVNECIKTLANNNITTGVISEYNKPITFSIRDKLIENDIYIDKYVSFGCIDYPTKDNMIKHIMKSISLDERNQVLLVENNPENIIENKKLGYNTIGISGYRWQLRDKMIQAGANHVIDTLDISSILNK